MALTAGLAIFAAGLVILATLAAGLVIFATLATDRAGCALVLALGLRAAAGFFAGLATLARDLGAAATGAYWFGSTGFTGSALAVWVAGAFTASAARSVSALASFNLVSTA